MECIFCAIVDGDTPGHVLFQNDRMFSFFRLRVSLIAPFKHFVSLEGLDDQTSAAILQTATKVANAILLKIGFDDINLMISDGQSAGQDVFHLNLHLKPGWDGDDVTLRWNTATALEAGRTALAYALKAHLRTTAVVPPL